MVGLQPIDHRRNAKIDDRQALTLEHLSRYQRLTGLDCAKDHLVIAKKGRQLAQRSRLKTVFGCKGLGTGEGSVYNGARNPFQSPDLFSDSFGDSSRAQKKNRFAPRAS